MLEIKKEVDLKKYNSLKIANKAKYFAVISAEENLKEALCFANLKNLDIIVLGGGTNILVSKKINALVLKNELKGIKLKKETKNHVYLEASSGQWWSSLVDYCLKNNWSGLENLYYVPGTVGAAPVQNIGAYGVELKDHFFSLRAFDFKTGKIKVFRKKDCQFAYRHSIFKGKYKNRFFILSLIVKLNKKAKLKLDYGDIKKKLEEKNIVKPSILELANVIKEIRDSKLPNPAVLANAGSFFKNPEISKAKYKKLVKKYPDIKSFKASSESLVKIPAGWLIEKAGFKGKRFNKVAMYEKQALILVNYGNASALDVLNLVNKIKRKVKKYFDIELQEEVIIL